MEIVKQFGLDPVLLIAQIINFLIIFFILKKFAFRPILTLLESRKKTIQEGLGNAKLAKEALDAAIEKEKQILQKAQKESQELLSAAQKQAEQLRSDIEEKTKMQVESMLADAHEKILKESKEQEKRIAVAAAQLAVSMVEKTLTDYLPSDAQSNVVKKFAASLKKK
jgi:F-type H+-transporting ATPase subunit b